GIGDSPRLVAVERVRLARVDQADVAPPRAVIAADEEGGLPVFPAFEDVRAAGLLAHGVQAFTLDQRLQIAVFRSHPGSCLDPGRLLLDRRLAVAHLDAQQATSLRCDAHPTSVRSAAKIVDRCRSTTGETSDAPTRRPDSAESDVTPASAIPQGTIWPNQFRSQSALRAKPCMVTPWATRMPMAA